jgi:hypothetical protein
MFLEYRATVIGCAPLNGGEAPSSSRLEVGSNESGAA